MYMCIYVICLYTNLSDYLMNDYYAYVNVHLTDNSNSNTAWV